MNRESVPSERQPSKQKVGLVRRCLRAIDDWGTRTAEANLAYEAEHGSKWVMPPAPVGPYVEIPADLQERMKTPEFGETLRRGFEAARHADMAGPYDSMRDRQRAIGAAFLELYPETAQPTPSGEQPRIQ